MAEQRPTGLEADEVEEVKVKENTTGADENAAKDKGTFNLAAFNNMGNVLGRGKQSLRNAARHPTLHQDR